MKFNACVLSFLAALGTARAFLPAAVPVPAAALSRPGPLGMVMDTYDEADVDYFYDDGMDEDIDPATMKVREIKAELDMFKADYSDCFEKSELVQRLKAVRANPSKFQMQQQQQDYDSSTPFYQKGYQQGVVPIELQDIQGGTKSFFDDSVNQGRAASSSSSSFNPNQYEPYRPSQDLHQEPRREQSQSRPKKRREIPNVQGNGPYEQKQRHQPAPQPRQRQEIPNIQGGQPHDFHGSHPSYSDGQHMSQNAGEKRQTFFDDGPEPTPEARRIPDLNDGKRIQLEQPPNSQHHNTRWTQDTDMFQGVRVEGTGSRVTDDPFKSTRKQRPSYYNDEGTGTTFFHDSNLDLEPPSHAQQRRRKQQKNQGNNDAYIGERDFRASQEADEHTSFNGVLVEQVPKRNRINISKYDREDQADHTRDFRPPRKPTTTYKGIRIEEP